MSQRGGQKYEPHMLRVYEAVIAAGDSNFSRARILLPSNFYFKEWEVLKESPTNVLMVDCFKFGFPARYE